MHRNRSTSKRSSSPNVVLEDSSALPQADGSCCGKPAAPEAEAGDELDEIRPPELPEFLKLNDGGK
jgi:protein-tyrosine phosphatase